VLLGVLGEVILQWDPKAQEKAVRDGWEWQMYSSVTEHISGTYRRCQSEESNT